MAKTEGKGGEMKKVHYWIDVPMFIVFGIPTFFISYAVFVIRAAYAGAECYFDKEVFIRRYTGKKEG